MVVNLLYFIYKFPVYCSVQYDVWNVDLYVLLAMYRYQFFLQIKRDIVQGRLPVSYELAAELAAYAVQCEFLCLNRVVQIQCWIKVLGTLCQM